MSLDANLHLAGIVDTEGADFNNLFEIGGGVILTPDRRLGLRSWGRNRAARFRRGIKTWSRVFGSSTRRGLIRRLTGSARNPKLVNRFVPAGRRCVVTATARGESREVDPGGPDRAHNDKAACALPYRTDEGGARREDDHRDAHADQQLNPSAGSTTRGKAVSPKSSARAQTSREPAPAPARQPGRHVSDQGPCGREEEIPKSQLLPHPSCRHPCSAMPTTHRPSTDDGPTHVRGKNSDCNRIVDRRPARSGGTETALDRKREPVIAIGQAHRQVVVFGQRRQAERHAAVALSRALQRSGTEASADARRRHGAGYPLRTGMSRACRAANSSP